MKELDIATGFLITLVVIGHLASRGATGVDWYVYVKTWIYRFHMPAFMFVSGAITFSSFSKIRDGAVVSYVRSRFFRLMSPYALFGALIIFGKGIVAEAINLPSLDYSIYEAFYDLFFYTSESPVGSLWYIYILFIFSVIFSFFKQFELINLYAVTLGSLVLLLMHLHFDLPLLFNVRLLCEYCFYFCLGGLYYTHRTTCTAVLKQAAIHGAALLCVLAFMLDDAYYKSFKVAISLSVIPILLFSSMRMATTSTGNFLAWIGSYSLTIYLTNTIFIAGTKAVLASLGITPAAAINYGSLLMVIVGIFGPILLHRKLLAKTPLASVTR